IVHGRQVSSSTGIRIEKLSGCIHAENPLNGSVPPQKEMTFVPNRAAICIFDESIAIIRSSLLIKASSSSRLSFPARLVDPGIFSCNASNLSESSAPPNNQNLHLCFSDISPISLTILLSGHIFSLCFAYGATPIFNTPCISAMNSGFKIVSGDGTIQLPFDGTTGKPALAKTSQYLSTECFN